MTRTTPPDQLLSEIAADTRELKRLADQQEDLTRQRKQTAASIKTTTDRRARAIKRAREQGVSVPDLAEAADLTPGRIRQVAPLPRKPTTPPADLRTAARPTVTTHVARVARATSAIERVPTAAFVAPPRTTYIGATGTGKTVPALETPALQPGQLSGIAAAVHQLVDGSTSVNLPPVEDDQAPELPDAPFALVRKGKRLPRVEGAFDIGARVHQARALHPGDDSAALADLLASAVQDAMTLLEETRTDATYDYTAHPSTPAPLERTGRKGADQIWEGRPSYTNASTPPGTVVTKLDINGAYLAALRRTHLPIGGLKPDDPGTPFDRRRSGIYLIQPPAWHRKYLPNPMGDAREEIGPVWVTDSTLRLLLRVSAPAAAVALCDPPVILQSYTSGNSESMLGKFGDVLAAARAGALRTGDKLTEEYVKALYSRFVSTAGHSRANHELERPEWVHAIRSQAFANIWYKAHKAWMCEGLTVHKMMGTDELHVTGPWRQAMFKGRPLFLEGRALTEVKDKGTYVVGEGR